MIKSITLYLIDGLATCNFNAKYSFPQNLLLCHYAHPLLRRRASGHYTGEKCPIHHVHNIRHVCYTWFPDDYKRNIRDMTLILYKLMEACKALLGIVDG